MILFPAIDLKDGQCVRLCQGRFEEKTVYGDDPAAMAARWAGEGAEWLHLVDLDASLGDSSANRRAIEKIRARVPRLKLQLGGGIRSLPAAGRWFDLGLERLIMGTVVCEDPLLAASIAQKYPGRVAAALDAVGQEVRVRGWKEAGGGRLFEVAAGLRALGAAMLIYTDVERDGTGQGPNVENTRRAARVSGLPTVCSGGVASLKDLEAIKPLAADGAVGAISGKALYAGTLDFAAGRALLAS
ncbi:MAG: 1-(5-phosphoribosyl)-5-((5-phosphoribosylamino)methylideneamino)imidazole-4-carboxamide isomerase [Candidatus Adiutrix sp.]|jgi:phosphoribosylformimino-5-aminoimidazole carboxamide ribotide isomerase|nr:1-(5-phosphoribosyl)-5-((5-phosphoribosylamino)methylideneamino)imidazole-4-carboxamide isomerase [Candidatus Adiutrix sp.]